VLNNASLFQRRNSPIDRRRRQADTIGDFPLRKAMITLYQREDFYPRCPVSLYLRP
jgi:hypothetical protein